MLVIILLLFFVILFLLGITTVIYSHIFYSVILASLPFYPLFYDYYFRRIALKALNERFAKADVSSRTPNEVIEWPSLIDPDDTQKTDNNKSDESSVIIELPTITNPSTTDTLNTLNSSNM
ncbi:unnamed protein product [Schistosoma mattheei]|uniref:Uncharacterized protein n=1 Tax=Schistosoma mattheei TaxID=31246 RepID=A0A183PYY9_9TREM|nr:unnamed protein product [Schistosoma mattheei]